MLAILKAITHRRRAIPLRPDPDYRARRLAQMTPERRQRYFENIKEAGL
jgi:transcription elongation GreA/GreB family factor